MKKGNSVLAGLDTTVFETMSRQAYAHGAINLGQGFPDDRGPADILQAAADALLDGWNQYPPMRGLPELRWSVADHDRRRYGLTLDWTQEVLVTSGATEALAACLFGLIEPGDEVVLIQPLYDAYLPLVRRAGGVPRFVTLRPPDWRLTQADLAAAVTDRTRLILFNNPLNPAAKVFDAAELDLLAAAAEAAGAVVVCDEVYEHLVFDGLSHTPLITRPGMRHRCLKIGSAGKTFSLTGWKVGYVAGSPDLLAPVVKAHQFLVFTTPPHLQTAVAQGLLKPAGYFDELRRVQQGRRDRLAAGLHRLGLTVLPCRGTYFVTVDAAGFGVAGDDVAVCRALLDHAKVAAIPLSAFYAEKPLSSLIRLCFAKHDVILDAALHRLEAFLARRAAETDGAAVGARRRSGVAGC